MRQNLLSITGYFILITFLIGSSCKPVPYIIEYKNIKGYVIGKETCNTDDTKDYWLIDFTYGANNPKIGDTLVLNGITYTNVLKTNGLDLQLKTVGLRVSIDYNTITTDKNNNNRMQCSNPNYISIKRPYNY